MPWEPAAPPLLSDENANELGRWALQQLQQLAAALENPDITAYRVLHVEPEKPREGQIVVADGSDWDPGDGPGQYMFIGGQWVIQRAGPEPNTYGIITDGTTPAPAEVAGDTFKVRGANGVKVTTQNDDATHGDNALFEMDINGITTATPALDDKVPFGDTSNSNAIRRSTPQEMYDLINALTAKSPIESTDYVAMYDATAGVAKKALTSEFGGRILLGTQTLSGTTIDQAIPSWVREIEILIHDMSGDTNPNIPRLAFSANGGSSFLAPRWRFDGTSAASGTTSPISISPALAGNAASILNGLYRVLIANDNEVKHMFGSSLTDNVSNHWYLSAAIPGGAPIDFMRFTISAGNFDGGSISVWGHL